jgi:hypothetical protein
MMDEALRAKLGLLSDKLIDAATLVSSALDAEDPQPQEIDRANDAVASVAQQWSEILAAIPETDRESAERSHGRRVTDLQREGARLPQRMDGRAEKVVPASLPGWPDYYARARPEQEAAGGAAASAPTRRAPPAGPRVGSDVEGWCGPCGGLRDHTIVAVVGSEIKQVICQSCGGRHGHRTTPARGKAAATAEAKRGSKSRGQAESQRREDARMALQKELASAEAVRPFVRRERYKVGEIIQHPELGRGKIENVLKGSLLVRFRDGLKSVSNF